MDNRIEAVTPKDFDEIEEVWEASVRATHDFLAEEDILTYKSLYPACLRPLSLFCIRKEGAMAGFIGISGKKVEVLFIRPDMRCRGIGRSLMEFAIHNLGAVQVDVNEQNTQALAFYLRLGFAVAGRSATDGLNKPYPLLHLQLALSSF